MAFTGTADADVQAMRPDSRTIFRIMAILPIDAPI